MSASTTYNDKELLTRIAEGEEAAFTQFFKSTLPYLKSHLIKILKNNHAFQEVLQNTYIRIWLNRSKLIEVDYIIPYIRKIAAREAFTYLNKKPEVVLLDTSHDLDADYSINDVEQKISYNETYRLVQEAIRDLPEQRRIIYQMSRLEGLKSPEIAKRLQLSAGYVRNAISAAQQAIVEKLSSAGKLIVSFIAVLLFFSWIVTLLLFSLSYYR